VPLFRNKRTYHRNIYHVLKDWYGKDRAGTEMVNYCPKAEALGDMLDGIMEKAMPPEQVKMLKIKSEWAQVAGADLSKVCTPVGIKNGIVEIEVNHPVWMRELRGQVKAKLIEQINQRMGENFCKDLYFVPGGRNAPPR